MKLAILCGANPRAYKVENGATVRVHEGNWKVVLEGVTDSVIALQLQSTKKRTIIKNNMPLNIPVGGDSVCVVVLTPGAEDYISAYLETT